MSGLIGIGQSGLAAAYAQLQATGQNITNVNTPGYVRQEVVLETAPARYIGAGWLGSGVNVASIQRNYDAFLGRQVTQNQAFAGGDAVRAQMLGQLDDLFGDTDSGLGVAMDELRSALADVVNQPADPGARQAVVSQTQSLAAQFRATGEQLVRLGEAVDQRLADGARKVSADLATIAELNRQIVAMNQAGKMPSDLLDQRDRLIDAVAGRMQVSRHDQADGSVSLLSANGHGLVVGTQAASLSTRTDPADPSKTQVVLNIGANRIGLTAASIGSGELAGLMRFRDEDLAAAQARVGQLAVAVAGAYNAAHAQGVDARGNPGEPLFEIGAPLVMPAATNVGGAELEVTITDPSRVVATDYRLSFNGTAYQLENLADGTVQEMPALPAEIGGLQLRITAGAMTIGDSMLIKAASPLATGMQATISDGRALATGYAAAVEMAPTNAGTVSVVDFASDSADPNAAAPIAITFTSATTFNVTGTGTGDPVGLSYVPGEPVRFNGWTLTLQGTPVPGDTVNVTPTADAGSDNRNARAMVALADQPLVDGATFSSAFSALLADVGTRTARSQAAADSTSALLANAEAAFASASGVNLDEEAARLLQYQQAYQASAQLISTAHAMFDTLLAVVQRS